MISKSLISILACEFRCIRVLGSSSNCIAFGNYDEACAGPAGGERLDC